jgi:hypothetical protein
MIRFSNHIGDNLSHAILLSGIFFRTSHWRKASTCSYRQNGFWQNKIDQFMGMIRNKISIKLVAKIVVLHTFPKLEWYDDKIYETPRNETVQGETNLIIAFSILIGMKH